jgi:ABC-type phosphate transport system auxiliary subunit
MADISQGAKPRVTNATQQYVDSSYVTLREYLEALIKNLELRMEEHFTAQDKANELYALAQEKRLDSMNEFRESLKDQTKTYITRSTLEARSAVVDNRIDALKTEIDDLKIAKATLDGKASQSSLYISYLLNFVALLIGIVGIVFRLAGK